MEILFFTSPTCAWCSYLKTLLDKVFDENPEFANHLSVNIIDISVQPEMAEIYGILSLPTMILPSGQKIIGTVNKEFLEKILKSEINVVIYMADKQSE